MEPREGKTTGRPSPEDVYTRLARIAELAREAPGMAFTTLAHHIDTEFLREAYRSTHLFPADPLDRLEEFLRDSVLPW
jgi:hypothetical protein